MKYVRRNDNLKDIAVHLRNKNLSIFNNSRLIQRVSNRLSQGILWCRMNLRFFKGFKLVVSEQIIENTLVFKNLREKDKTILDFGGYESILPLQLSALGYKVTVLDQRKYPFHHPNLKVLCSNLFSDGLRITDKFDVVISISTIEHLGLTHYGNLLMEDADVTGVKILWDLVKNGGRLMVSVPAGKPAIQRGYRIYNEKRINEVFPNISSTYWFAKNGREGTWHEVRPEMIDNMIYSEPFGQMPVEGVVFVICDKVGE